MSTRARLLTGALALTAALVLGGCAGAPSSVVTRLPTDSAPSAVSTVSPSPTPTATSAPSASTTPAVPADDPTDCADGERTLAGSSQTFVITGDCPVVRIEGNTVTVDAAGAGLGTVIISGDRIRLDAGALADVTIRGNDVTVNAASTQNLTIRGDRNTVSASGGSARVLVSGNDNVVIAPSADVVDEGQRNSIR